MTGRLSTRLGLVLLALLLVLGAGYWLIVNWVLERHRLEVNQSLNRGVAASLVREYEIFDDDGVSADGLEHVFHTLMAINPAIEVYLLNTQGEILEYSAPYRAVELDRVDMAPVQRFVGDATAYPIRGDNPRAPGERNVFSAAPIAVNGETMGYLYIILGGDQYEAVTATVGAGTTRWLSTGAIAALVGFGILAGFVVFRLFTVRLRRLDDAMRAFAEDCENGNCSPIEAPTGSERDELDRLTGRFAQLTNQISDQLETIQRSDQLRRQLVANVSHDFRTPLAALDGYLQTLLMKNDELSAVERKEYLEIAAKSGQRLTRLVKELFELSRLEAADRAPNPEPFCLSELASDVISKFNLLADEKSLSLELTCEPEALHAYAEIGLIERVLENLLANAIAHTPEGGFVRVALQPEAGDSVQVSVHDSGAGISKRELPHIFERFYRAESKSADDGEGSGLGLAIVKRIIELHRSRIVARSEQGEGSAFVFWLPQTEVAATAP